MGTYVGTAGNDTLNGSANRDLIKGLAGDDLINGGPNRDTMSGGDGNDTIIGQQYADDIFGGNGNDVITAGNQSDVIYGEGGDDLIYGDYIGTTDLFSDVVYGGAGNDTIYVGNGNGSRGAGGIGDDVVFGGDYNDSLSGGAGNDSIASGSGNDHIFLGGGNDTIIDFDFEHDTLDLGSLSLTGTGHLSLLLSTDGNGDAVLDLGGGNSVTFEGLTEDDITATDLGALTTHYSQSDIYTVASSGYTNINNPGIEELTNGDLAVVWESASSMSGSIGNDIFFQILTLNDDDSIPGVEGFDSVTGITLANSVQDTVQGIDEVDGTQRHARMEATDDGGFALIWEDVNGTNPDPYLKYFDSVGGAVDIDGDLDNTNDGVFISTDAGPSVSNKEFGTTTLDNGDIVALYSESDGGKFTIIDRDTSSIDLGTEISYTSNIPVGERVASLADGGFVVAWGETAGDTGSKYQRFEADGTAIDGSPVEFRNANSNSIGLTGLRDGGFVISQVGGYPASDHKLYLFDADGTLKLETGLQDPGVYPYGSRYSIVALDNGGFAVGFDGHLSGTQAYVTTFRADGSVEEEAIPIGAGQSSQADVGLSALDGGGFAATWFTANALHMRVFEADTTSVNRTAEPGEPTYGGWGNDTLTGTSSSDYLWGDAGSDTLIGGLSGDSIFGGTGDDLLSGGDGGDSISGGADADTIIAGADNDLLVGGVGNDVLSGGAGADTLRGGAGSDVLVGGAGSDRFAGTATELDGDSITDFSDGDSIVVSGIDLTSLDNTISNGTIDLGGGKSVTIYGTSGEGLSAAYNGGTGETTITLSGVDLTGTAAGETLTGSESYGDSLSGLAGADTLSGRGGDDTLSGGADGDQLFGGSGADTLRGGSGEDTLSGGGGADTLVGGSDNDVLAGGSGDDLFVIGGSDGDDTIVDFVSAADVIDITATFVDQTALAAAATDVGSNVVIDIGGGQTLTLLGVQSSGLLYTDFI